MPHTSPTTSHRHNQGCWWDVVRVRWVCRATPSPESVTHSSGRQDRLDRASLGAPLPAVPIELSSTDGSSI